MSDFSDGVIKLTKSKEKGRRGGGEEITNIDEKKPTSDFRHIPEKGELILRKVKRKIFQFSGHFSWVIWTQFRVKVDIEKSPLHFDIYITKF